MDANPIKAIAQFRCSLCGGKLRPGMPYVFMGEPERAVHNLSSTPPSHAECARKAALAKADVTVLIFVRSFETLVDSKGLHFFRLSRLISAEWFCEGRATTREEVMQGA